MEEKFGEACGVVEDLVDEGGEVVGEADLFDVAEQEEVGGGFDFWRG